jgi:hypothetical protein
VSLDCEFTGIKGRPETMIDTPDERYDKVIFLSTSRCVLSLRNTRSFNLVFASSLNLRVPKKRI